MYNCLRKFTAHFSPKILAFLFVFMMICAGISAQTATITNPTDTTGWETTDTVSFTTSKTITFPASSSITIQNLIINAGNNVVTLDLNGSTLKILKITGPGAAERSGRLRLGNNQTGQLIVKNGTIEVDEFDTNDDGNNSLTLDHVSFTVTTSLFTNGLGTTTITAVAGDTDSSFIIPSGIGVCVSGV